MITGENLCRKLFGRNGDSSNSFLALPDKPDADFAKLSMDEEIWFSSFWKRKNGAGWLDIPLSLQKSFCLPISKTSIVCA
jgi:hypothetical protein